MVFNLKKQKIAMDPLPPIADITSPESPLYASWIQASATMLPIYQSHDPSIQNIDDAMRNLIKTPEEVIEEANAVDKETLNEQQDVISTIDSVNSQLQSMVSKKTFNLKKAQQPQIPFDPMGLNDSPEMVGDELEMMDPAYQAQRKFNGKIDFFNWLTRETNQEDAKQYIISSGEDNGQMDTIRESIERFYTSTEKDAINVGKTLEVYKEDQAFAIYEELPDNLKEGQGEIMTQPKHFGEIQNIIKKLAEKTVKNNNKKVFNLNKTAQHKTIDNAILWGPEQSRIDPFLRQPVSDWHIVERNKGFGLVVDDVWNIDYETIWRENVMDKFSRPYRDKEGNWVGGYLHKRFEMDKNIPVTSNYQLKPGEKRRPVVPEYGNTESRLQAARAAGDIEGAIDTSKPFNWKEASSKKKS